MHDLGGAESIGRRQAQEDFYGFIESDESGHKTYLALADGMGGHVGGAIASQTVVEAYLDFVTRDESAHSRLVQGLNYANKVLGQKIDQSENLRGMGCTFIGLALDGQNVRWVSVGDSVLFHYRDKVLRRLNEDHSMVPLIEAQLKRGEITQKQAMNHPDRHVIRSAVMGEPIPLVDSPDKPLILREGDILLAASDGVETLELYEIEASLSKISHLPAEQISQELIDLVLKKDALNQDNVTIAVCKYVKSASTSTPVTKPIKTKGTSVSENSDFSGTSMEADVSFHEQNPSSSHWVSFVYGLFSSLIIFALIAFVYVSMSLWDKKTLQTEQSQEKTDEVPFIPDPEAEPDVKHP